MRIHTRTEGLAVFDENSQKTPLAQSLLRLARSRGQDATSRLGLSLPCTVSQVTSPWVVEVNFEVSGPWTLPKMTVPVLGSPRIADPIKVGDKGVTLAASSRLGGLSGLGSGTPNLQDQPGNLSCLGFIWLGSTDLITIDPEALALNGNIAVTPTQLGFFANPKVDKQSLTGALSDVSDAAAKAVLQSIVDALCDSGYGLTKDETS